MTDIFDEVLAAVHRDLWQAYTYPTDMSFLAQIDAGATLPSFDDHYVVHGLPSLMKIRSELTLIGTTDESDETSRGRRLSGEV